MVSIDRFTIFVIRNLNLLPIYGPSFCFSHFRRPTMLSRNMPDKHDVPPPFRPEKERLIDARHPDRERHLAHR